MTESAEAKPLKVAIVGTAPTSRHLAPCEDPDWEIWACSAGNVDQLSRVTVWYEMHALNEMLAPENKAMSEPFYKWLRDKSDAGAFSVVMIDAGTELGGKNALVPKAIPYPKDSMVKMFGRNWFTSSVAYMMAVAIAKGAKEIALFGVDMAADQEHYQAQRAGCVRFIEIAEANGIVVHVPFESSLKTAPPMYGYWEGTPFGRRINAVLAMVNGIYAAKVAQRDALNNEINYFGGAAEQLRYFQRTWVDGAELEVDYGNVEALVAASEAEAAKAQAAATSPPTGPATVASALSGETAAPYTPGPALSMAEFDQVLPPAKPNGAGTHDPEPGG